MHVHSIRFVKMNRRWVAQVFIDANTCVSWQTVGSRRNVDRIVRTQLRPNGIRWTIEAN